jgi:hypothetical protein
MAEFVVQMIVTLCAFLLWLVVVSLLARPFGVRMPLPWLGFGDRKILQTRSLYQHILVVGVLYWGCGMVIVTTLWDYLNWKYSGGSYQNLSVDKILIRAVIFPMAGILFGWRTWHSE